MYEKYFKRLLDIILSGGTIIFLSPVLLFVAILIRVNLGSPIIFKQKRPGKDEKLFYLYKFRTMTDERDSSGSFLPDSKRLTKFGRLLRSTSLDELPELLNILKGEMSFIGPRPLAIQYLPYYTELERQRHSIRPGLTGLAQTNGRNSISWEKRFEFDIQYIKELSFFLDCKILLDTVSIVFLRNDIGERGIDVSDFDKYRINQLKGLNNSGN